MEKLYALYQKKEKSMIWSLLLCKYEFLCEHFNTLKLFVPPMQIFVLSVWTKDGVFNTIGTSQRFLAPKSELCLFA